jgi:hypothetical protein
MKDFLAPPQRQVRLSTVAAAILAERKTHLLSIAEH